MGKKIIGFYPNWALTDCNSSLNSSMAMKWCKKLAVALKRCPIIFQGHPSIFKVTWDKKSSMLTGTESFQTVTPVWIHWWIWNDAQSLMWYRRGDLLIFGVIHQISRTHGLTNRWFESNLSKITRPVAAIKSLRFALFFLIWMKTWMLIYYYCRYNTLYMMKQLILSLQGASYHVLIRSVLWLLMPWLLVSPGHHQPKYWLCEIVKS